MIDKSSAETCLSWTPGYFIISYIMVHCKTISPCSLPFTPWVATRTTWSSGNWSRNCPNAGPSPAFVLKFLTAQTSPLGSRTTTLCPTFLGQCSTPFTLIDAVPIPPSSSPPSARTSNCTLPKIIIKKWLTFTTFENHEKEDINNYSGTLGTRILKGN